MQNITTPQSSKWFSPNPTGTETLWRLNVKNVESRGNLLDGALGVDRSPLTLSPLPSMAAPVTSAGAADSPPSSFFHKVNREV